MASGWDAKYRGIAEYLKLAKLPSGHSLHLEFLAKRKKLKETSEKDGASGKRIRLNSQQKHDVQNVKELSLNSTQGRKRTAPTRTFVPKDVWDAALDGEYDPALEVEEDMFGVVKKGIWKWKGRQGTMEEECYHDKGIEDKTYVTDNSGVFGEERFKHKRDQAQKCFLENEAWKNKHTHAGPAITNDAFSLLAMISKNQIEASGQICNAASGQASPLGEHEGSSESSSDEGNGEAAGDICGFFAKDNTRPKKGMSSAQRVSGPSRVPSLDKTKASSQAGRGQPARSSASPRRGSARAGVGSAQVRAGSAHAATISMASSPATVQARPLVMDGRTR